MPGMEHLKNWFGLKRIEGHDHDEPELDKKDLKLVPGEIAGILPHDAAASYVYDYAGDWREYECLSLEVYIPNGETVELKVTVYPLVTGRPEFIEHTTASVVVTGAGWTTVEIAFEQFDYWHFASAFWRFIHRVELKAIPLNSTSKELAPGGVWLKDGVFLKQRGFIALTADRLSQTVEAGQIARYGVSVTNQTARLQAVKLGIQLEGWETMQARLEREEIILAPGESQTITLLAEAGEDVAPGGYEVHRLIAVPEGKASEMKRIELITARALPHPYILHTESGWDQVQANVERYGWARLELAEYVRQAEEWEVPEVKGGEYAFELKERFSFYASAVAWKLTGRREFLEKAALLLRRLADPERGYPATAYPVFHIYASRVETARPTPRPPKVCSGGLIHEGEFFLSIASGYDLIYAADIWSEEDHCRIEAAFCLFIEKVDWAITDGDVNNIPSGALVGALLCSLAIQDMYWIQRFIHGPNGYGTMLATGVMDDGWYFESAVNYVVLFADMFTRAAQACLPWGINLKDMYVPASYRRDAMLSPWSQPQDKPFLGMSFQKWGPSRRNYRCLRDLWDAMVPYIDYRGILFGANDSTEYDLSRLYDMAYYLWRNPDYVPVIRNTNRRDLLYALGDLPEVSAEPYLASAYSDNVGLCVLRSQTPGREPKDQLQAVIKYGSHGGYHGHYDRASLMTLMRLGKSAISPLSAWYAYYPYMFKMWVQTSMAHHMVVVDQRMQEPVPSKRLMYYAGSMLQACAVETNARWSDPPYGGQTPYPEKFPQERMWNEGRGLPIPSILRQQGDIGEYSERILQRRLLLVSDDYIVTVDYLGGEEEHVFDCLNHFQGFRGLSGDRVELMSQTGQMNDDPFGAAQFITDCHWYACEGTTLARFSHVYDQERDGSRGRHGRYSEAGPMNIDVHAAWPPQREMMSGWFPEADAVNKQVHYEIWGDDRLLEQGRLGTWILGAGRIKTDLRGVKKLKLMARTESKIRKTLFWGGARILTEDGRSIPLSELDIQLSNVDCGSDSLNDSSIVRSLDYEGGPIHLEGVLYETALPFEPLDQQHPAMAVIDLRSLNAVRFEGVLGGDYPVGEDEARRTTISQRVSGKEAVFVTVIEAYEGEPLIRSVKAETPEQLVVALEDGRVQWFDIQGMESQEGVISVRISEYVQGRLVREEMSK